LSYKHLGSEISPVEAKKSVRELKDLINTVTASPLIDSPMYSFIPKVVQPKLAQEDFDQIIGELRTREDSIYSLMENAKELMAKDDFVNAAQKWKRLSEMVENDSFFVQQYALSVYKSKTPNKLVALTDALTIIDKLKPFNDAESLGIAGAINKNLWRETKDVEFLNIAIKAYKKGWSLFNDYYTGENYANCLEHRALEEQDLDIKTYYRIEAKRTRTEVISIVLPLLSVPEEELEEVKWRSATLSNCYRALGDIPKSEEYEQKFLSENPVPWEVGTFETTKKELIELNKI
jgi:tetratricopeptide (TPR) repeat protein